MNEKTKKLLREWVLPFLTEFILLALFLHFVASPTYVPTGSMVPTIAEGSWLVSTRVYDPVDKLERGDIVSFYSDEFGKVLIKRLIGLPGDKVELKEDGSVFVNGAKLEEPYVVNQSDGYTEEFEVPANCFLFFGDNRPYSEDARFWDNPYIPADKILSKAVFTLWPLKNLGPLK